MVTTTITGNPIYDLLLVGAVGGALIGFVIFSGVLRKIWINLIIRSIFPVTCTIKRPLANGTEEIKADYGRKQFYQKDKKAMFLALYKNGKSDAIQNEDIYKVGDELRFDGYEDKPGHIVALKTQTFQKIVKQVKEDGTEELVGVPLSLSEPKLRVEAEIFRREATNSYARDVRYKKKEPKWWMNPAMVQYVGTAILIFCTLFGMSIALPKIVASVQQFSDTALVRCESAGISAGVQVFEGLVSGRMNITNIRINSTIPPDAPNPFGGLSNLIPKTS